jgi:hypothetical protein
MQVTLARRVPGASLAVRNSQGQSVHCVTIGKRPGLQGLAKPGGVVKNEKIVADDPLPRIAGHG